MFTRAGHARPRAVVCTAVVRRWNRRWARMARLCRFPDGSYAWLGGGGRASWPEHIRIVSHPALQVGSGAHRPRSLLTERPA